MGRPGRLAVGNYTEETTAKGPIIFSVLFCAYLIFNGITVHFSP